MCSDISVSDTLPGVSNAHEQIHGAEGPQDGFIGEGLKFMPIQRTDSCNSLGSEGAPFTAGAGGMNGHHQGYQGLSCSLVIPYQHVSSTMEVSSL